MLPRANRVAVAASIACVSMAWSSSRAAAEPASSVIKLPSGVTLHYVVQGDPGGEVVVLLHGAGDSWHSYDLVYPLLPAKYRTSRIPTSRLLAYKDTGHALHWEKPAEFTKDLLAFLAEPVR